MHNKSPGCVERRLVLQGRTNLARIPILQLAVDNPVLITSGDAGSLSDTNISILKLG